MILFLHDERETAVGLDERRLRASGELTRACEAFALISASDPQTQYVDVLPLPWVAHARQRVDARLAEKWFAADGQPALRLMGAAWLLDGQRRKEALSELERLSLTDDKLIAMLAMAQIWRTRLVTVDKASLDRWQKAAKR